MYLARLIDTTDRLLSTRDLIIKRLHQLLDRVIDLDRPFLFQDKLHVAVDESNHCDDVASQGKGLDGVRAHLEQRKTER